MEAPPYRDFVEMIAALSEADPERGIRLFDNRFRESFHTWRDLHRLVLCLAGQFLEEGVRPGQRVLVAMPTEIGAIGSFLALVWLGAIPFSISSPLLGQDREAHRRQVLNLIRLHGIEKIIASKDLAGIAGSARDAPAEMEIAPRAPDAEALGGAPDIGPASIAPDQVAFVQFSSGSTSHPKGVRITHRGLVTNNWIMTRNDRRTEESVWVSWLPLYHDMGLVGGLFTNLVHRNDLVQMHPICFMARPITWLHAISRWGGNATAMPNFALDHCVDRVTEEQLREHEIDLSTFRYIYNGAEPVRPASIRRFEEKFGPWGFGPGRIYPVYGMSESTLIISAPARDENLVRREIGGVDVPSVGWPLGDFEVCVRDESGRDLGPDTEGEICIRGTCVTPGYLMPQGETDDSIRDGWLPTGDLGQLDREGRIYITGRKNDLINRQGRNFFGHDIAARLEELPYVRKGRVFAFETELEGSARIVVMTAPPGRGSEALPEGDSFEDALRRAVMREFGLPVDDVCIVPNIPKTTSGKVARHLCERIYRESLESRGGR